MWARIAVFLVAALLLAAAGGAWFGHMLIRQAPQSPAARAADAPLPVTDLGGSARVPEPPQPRVDGSLGVPTRVSRGGSQNVPLVSVLEDDNRAIALSTTSTSPEAQQSEQDLFSRGPTDFTIATVQAQPPQAQRDERFTRERPALPPELAFAVARPAEEPAGPPAWQQSLRASLARCGRQSFFSEEECEQRLRVQYCDPNGGWGRVPECPASQRNVRY